MARSSFAFMSVSLHADLADNELRLQRKLCGSKGKGLAGKVLVNAVHFIEHAARLDQRNPVFRVTLTVTHTDFGGFARNGLVRKHTDPHTAAALDVARQSTTCSFDLTGRQA